jgi:uracil-DNA glycosylase
MDLYTHTKQNIPEGWEELFRIADPEIKQISGLLEKEKSKSIRIVPDVENTFRVFHMCKPENVRVVIIAQDVYFQIRPNGKPRALGIAFSVSKEDEIPSSLRNIYKEIKSNYPTSVIPEHGDISDWVSQGVFLLNSCLTCRVGEPGSHTKYKLWLPFFDRFLKYLSSINKDVIFVLWGKDAQNYETMIEKGFRNILKASHPSGLSASRGFFGCGHFKQINDIIRTQNEKSGKNNPEIKWLELEKPSDKEDSLATLYIEYFAKEIDKDEMKDLTTHYSKYYEEMVNKHNENDGNNKENTNPFTMSLEEYTIYMITYSVFTSYVGEKDNSLTYEELLKKIRENFEKNKEKGFYKVVLDFQF